MLTYAYAHAYIQALLSFPAMLSIRSHTTCHLRSGEISKYCESASNVLRRAFFFLAFFLLFPPLPEAEFQVDFKSKISE
jgi:hypothetical protein